MKTTEVETTQQPYRGLALALKNELQKELQLFLEKNYEATCKIKFSVIKNQQMKNLLSDDYYFYSTNLAFLLSKVINKAPLQLAKQFVKFSNTKNFIFIKKLYVTAPGFINIALKSKAFAFVLQAILQDQEQFAQNIVKHPEKINIEYVSVNPTGYLHFGHARGAVYGDILSRVLKHIGHEVENEYYINDAGNQIKLLAKSVLVKYQQLFGKKVKLPKDAYKGKDIEDAALILKASCADKYLEIETSDQALESWAVNFFLAKIKKTLQDLKVHHDTWSSEKALVASGAITKVIQDLGTNVYQKDGALFLKTTLHDDDKDRVLIKSDGSFTYLLPDVAYHLVKAQNRDKLINVWGADHSGYIKRMQIALELLGLKKGILEVDVVQLVRVIREGQELKMSKRAGTSVFLKDVLKISGTDATRWLLSSRELSTKFDFDVDISKQKDEQNPCFYVQYNYARMHSLLAKTQLEAQIGNYSKLSELDLIFHLDAFYQLLYSVSQNRQIHLLNNYLLQLAKKFSHFYASCKILKAPNESALIALVKSIAIILKLGLSLLGISAPQQI